MSYGIRVQGIREVERALLDLGVDLADLKRVYGNIATEAANLAASFAPKRTGALARSIRGSKARNYARVTIGNLRQVPYAGAINWGWPAHNIAGAHFVERTDEVMKPRSLGLLQRELQHLIDKAAIR